MIARLLASLLFGCFSVAAFSQSAGTGFFVSSAGYVVTAHHVVDGAEEISVRDSRGTVQRATLVRADKGNDLAVLKVGVAPKVLPIAPSTFARRGTEVFTVGYPRIDVQGVEPKVTHGIVSALSGLKDDPRFLQTSTPVQPGNSGGPLVNRNGQVVGVIVGKLSDAWMITNRADIPQNVNFAVKSVFLIELLRSIQGLDFDLAEQGPRTSSRGFEELAAEAERATVIVLSTKPTLVTSPATPPPASRDTRRTYSRDYFGAYAYSTDS